MSSNRDNFSKPIRRALAGRAGHRCSICKSPTIGPSDESSEAVMDVGVAAHITAAAAGPGARRHDGTLTSRQRSDIDNGIWLCQTCSVIIDRDEERFTPQILRDIRRDHTEFVRLGAVSEPDVGLVAIGPDIIAAGRFTRFASDIAEVRMPFFFRGTASDTLDFIRRFEDVTPFKRYILSSEFGTGGLLEGAPTLVRDGAAWTLRFTWQAEAPRRFARDMRGMSDRTGRLISGEDYWTQCFSRALSQPPGTWYADMDGGSFISELYQNLRDSTWFEHLVTCEFVRLACVPAPPRFGEQRSEFPPFQCVRRVHSVRVPDPTLVDERLNVVAELELEGHGRWTGELGLFVYDREGLRAERAKGRWMTENVRRIEAGERALPSPLPPEGWTFEDDFPK